MKKKIPFYAWHIFGLVLIMLIVAVSLIDLLSAQLRKRVI